MPVADFEVEGFRQVAADHAAGAVVLERVLLILGNAEFAIDGEKLIRLHGETGELVLWDRGRPYMCRRTNWRSSLPSRPATRWMLRLIGERHHLRERDAVARHHAQGLAGVGIGQVETVIQPDHHAQQTHGNRRCWRW